MQEIDLRECPVERSYRPQISQELPIQETGNVENSVLLPNCQRRLYVGGAGGAHLPTTATEKIELNLRECPVEESCGWNTVLTERNTTPQAPQELPIQETVNVNSMLLPSCQLKLKFICCSS